MNKSSLSSRAEPDLDVSLLQMGLRSILCGKLTYGIE